MTLDELKILKRKFVKTLPETIYMVGLGNDEIFVYLKPEDDASVIPAEFEGVKITIREHPGHITAL